MILLMDFCPRAGECRAREGRTRLPCPSMPGAKKTGGDLLLPVAGDSSAGWGGSSAVFADRSGADGSCLEF